MSIEWDDYEFYEPAVAGPPKMMTRADARKVYERCMETRPVRIQALRGLLKANGVDLGTDDGAIQDLNDWFYKSVAPDPSLPGGLAPEWHSVVHDVALFLGDVMIERYPSLHWEFFTWGKKNIAYQRHVIMGFTTEERDLHTNIDIQRWVSQYAHRIVESRGSIPTYGKVNVRGTAIDIDAVAARSRGQHIETDAFWRWLAKASQRA